jgi:hypothetical protein
MNGYKIKTVLYAFALPVHSPLRMNTFNSYKKAQAREEPAPFVSGHRGATLEIGAITCCATEGDTP